MPNNTANILEISGDNFEQVKLCVLRLKNEDTETAIDFNKVIPLPDKLTSAYHMDIGERDMYGIPLSQREQLKTLCGFTNWYDWSVANWNTKWNAYSVDEWKFNESTKTATLYFETAWNPPH